MTLHFGNVDAGSILYIPFHTFDSNGASITLTGLAVTDIEIYKNGSVTQRASDAGYTLLDTDGIDFDAITGIHGFSVDLSDNTDTGFYAAGSFYWVVVSAVTVDTRTVNFVAATFRIGPAAVNVTQLLGTAWLAPAVAGTPDVNTKLAGGTAWGSGAITAASIAADAITAAKIADGTIDAATFAAGAINASAIASDAITDAKVAADVTIASVTGAVGSVTGTVGGFTAAAKAEIESEVNDALVVHRLDELLNADSDIDGLAPPTVGSVFHEMMSKTAGSFTFDQTTDSNEAIRDNMGTAQTGDSFARLGAPVGVSVSADIAAIEAQTDDIGAAGAGLTAVPWNAAWDAEVQSEVQDALDGTVADSVPADGARPSISQAVLMLTRFLHERSVSGTTLTVKKEDGATASMTFTLNDAAAPTSITRAT